MVYFTDSVVKIVYLPGRKESWISPLSSYTNTCTHTQRQINNKKIQLLVSKVQESDNNLRKNVGIIFISSLSLKALKIRQYIQNLRGKCTYLDLIKGKLKRILIVKSST